MRCDGSPDPTVQGEINTYINLRLEDTEHDDVESVFKASELDTKVIYMSRSISCNKSTCICVYLPLLAGYLSCPIVRPILIFCCSTH